MTEQEKDQFYKGAVEAAQVFMQAAEEMRFDPRVVGLAGMFAAVAIYKGMFGCPLEEAKKDLEKAWEHVQVQRGAGAPQRLTSTVVPNNGRVH